MAVTIIDPNPFSPFATADPAARHIFPGPPPLRPGALLIAICNELAVVPDVLSDAATTPLPDNICGLCLGVVDGLVLATPEYSEECTGCGGSTVYGGLCAACRQRAHDEWRDDPDGHEAAAAGAIAAWLTGDEGR